MATQDALSLASAIITLIKDSAPVFYAIGIAILLLLSWKRAGSAHFLFGRIWRLLGGDKEFTDPYLNAQWKQLRDLETIRFHTGIRFPSKNSATRTMAWLDLHEIALGELISAKRFFNPEQGTLEDPKLAQKQNHASALLISLLIVVVGLSWMNAVDEAFLTVRKTDTAFWTDGTIAKSWHRSGWLLTKADCDAGTTKLSEPHDNEVICQLLSEPKNPFIDQSIKEQRALNAGIICLCIVVFLIIIRKLMSAQLAHKLYRKLNPQP